MLHFVPQVHLTSLQWSQPVQIGLSSAKIQDGKPLHPSIHNVDDTMKKWLADLVALPSSGTFIPY